MTDERLIGWLCFLRHQWSNGSRCDMPGVVRLALEEKGWITVEAEPDWEGIYGCRLSDDALAVSDLYGPEWGIQTIPEPEGAD